MTKPDTQKALYSMINDLLVLANNLSSTGDITVKMNSQQGTIVDFSYIIENKSCYRRDKKVK